MRAILFLLFTLSLILNAQKVDIRGVVTDSTTGEKIPQATITILGTQRGAVTNNSGFYLITNVPFGKYDLVVTSIGYAPQKKSVVIVGAKPITVNFYISESAVEVSEVLVTGGRQKELLEINTSVHVLDAQEIKKVPVAAQDDLLRSIEIIPGIVSSADVNSKFYVRGGAGDQNLILLDGMKIYNPFHAFGIFSIFDPDIVRSTDVYTGAFPAGYGGRLSSVIDIHSRDGSTKGYHGQANINFISGKAAVEGPIGENSSILISGRKSLFDQTMKKFVNQSSPISFYDLFAKVNFGLEYGKQTFQMFLSGDDIVSDKPTDADHFWRTSSYSFTFSELLEDHIYVDAIAYASNFSIRREVEDTQFLTPAESKIQDGGIKAELTFYTESRDLFFLGFDVGVPRYYYKFYTGLRLLREVDDVNIETWMWARYQTTSDRLKADIGIHSDVISLFSGGKFLTSFQPRINLSYLLTDDWIAKFSYGVFSQNLITLTNEDDIVSLFEAWIFLPKGLEPEVAHHLVTGIEGNLYSELSFSMQAYLKYLPSLVVYNREKRFPFEPDYLNSIGRAYGIETLLRYGFTNIDLYTAYTLGWTSITQNNFTYSPRYDRRHTLNVLGVLRLTEHFDINARWEFGSGYPFSETAGYYDRLSIENLGRNPFYSDPSRSYSVLGEKNAAHLPAYHRMDVGASYHFKETSFQFTLGVNVVNIYNNKNILYYDRKTGQQINMLPFLPTAYMRAEF